MNELNSQHSSSLLTCWIGREQLDPGTAFSGVSPTRRPLKNRQGAAAEGTAQDGAEQPGPHGGLEESHTDALLTNIPHYATRIYKLEIRKCLGENYN